MHSADAGINTFEISRLSIYRQNPTNAARKISKKRRSGICRARKLLGREFCKRLIYDELAGLPEDGIPPGTAWEDIPADWYCPECGVTKADFSLVTE